ncbi:MAG: tRNA adenosine(34) deaminase TadA [Candidatus Auribacterota bacterium]|nr:tRNA adenosine(34) deaminase TadA [Candidatus Auribacterota bacterium]
MDIMGQTDIASFFTNPDDRFMEEALKEALKAHDLGEVPVGAVIVHEGRIIARAHNQVEMLNDATAHAEIIALTQASAALENWRLIDTTLYVTKEPCPMCAGAMVNARVSRLVYGVADTKYGAAGSVFDVADNPCLNHRIAVVGGVKEDRSRELLQSFFMKLRNKI